MRWVYLNLIDFEIRASFKTADIKRKRSLELIEDFEYQTRIKSKLASVIWIF